MPGVPVDPSRCPGYKNGCFFSRRLWPFDIYGYCCKKCRVEAPNVIAGGLLSGLCIKCYYADPTCGLTPRPCRKEGCQEEMAEVEERLANGRVDLSSSAEDVALASTGRVPWNRAAQGPAEASTGGAGSSRDDQNVLQMIQALKDEVDELNRQVRHMQAHIDQLEVWRINQEQQWHREWVDQPWHRERVDEEQPWHREWTAWAGRGEWER